MNNTCCVLVLLLSIVFLCASMILCAQDRWRGGGPSPPCATSTADKYRFDGLSSKAKDVVFSQILELISSPKRDSSPRYNKLTKNDSVEEVNKNEESNREFGENVQQYREGLIAGWCYALENVDIEKIKEELLVRYTKEPEAIDTVYLGQFQSIPTIGGVDVRREEEDYMTVYSPRSDFLIAGYFEGRTKVYVLVANSFEEMKSSIKNNGKEKEFSSAPTLEALLFLKQVFQGKMADDKVKILSLLTKFNEMEGE